MKTVLVTGATGNVGREVVRAARARGLRVRAADRGTTRARAALGSDVDVVRLDFRDPASFACADGADALFLMRPPAIADVAETLLPFIDEARRRGVKHIVFLSVAGAGNNPLVPHHAVERRLQQGTGWTILRPGFFAQNFGDAYRRDIHLRRRAMPWAQAGVQTVLHVGIRFGQAAHIDATLARLLAGRPHSLEEYFRDARAVGGASYRVTLPRTTVVRATGGPVTVVRTQPARARWAPSNGVQRA